MKEFQLSFKSTRYVCIIKCVSFNFRWWSLVDKKGLFAVKFRFMRRDADYWGRGPLIKPDNVSYRLYVSIFKQSGNCAMPSALIVSHLIDNIVELNYSCLTIGARKNGYIVCIGQYKTEIPNWIFVKFYFL